MSKVQSSCCSTKCVCDSVCVWGGGCVSSAIIVTMTRRQKKNPPLLLLHPYLLSLSLHTIRQSAHSHSAWAQLRLSIWTASSSTHTRSHTLPSCCWAQSAGTASAWALRTKRKDNTKRERRSQSTRLRMRFCVCSVPTVLLCRPTQLTWSFMPPLLLVLLLLNSSSSIRALPPLFQLAPDTPSPAEPTPTQATPRPDPCEGRPCLNGGFCLALPSAGRLEDTWEYACSCSQGFTGRNCEVRTHQPSTFNPGFIHEESDTAQTYRTGKSCLRVLVF